MSIAMHSLTVFFFIESFVGAGAVDGSAARRGERLRYSRRGFDFKSDPLAIKTTLVITERSLSNEEMYISPVTLSIIFNYVVHRSRFVMKIILLSILI